MKITKIPHSPIWQFAFRNPLDTVSNELARQAIEKIKEVSKEPPSSLASPKIHQYLFEFEDHSDNKNYSFKLKLSRVNENRKYISSGSSVKVIGNLQGNDNFYLIQGEVIIGNLFDNKCIGELQKTIKEIIRHELEHFSKQPITPEEAMERWISGHSDRKTELDKEQGISVDSIKKYLTNSREIDAFLRGYMTLAKNDKKPLSQVIKDMTSSFFNKSNASAEEKQEAIGQIISAYEARAKQIWPTYR